jgi:hypothetical protein
VLAAEEMYFAYCDSNATEQMEWQLEGHGLKFFLSFSYICHKCHSSSFSSFCTVMDRSVGGLKGKPRMSVYSVEWW